MDNVDIRRELEAQREAELQAPARDRLKPAALSEEQQRLRRSGITASNMAAVMGLDDYRSALDVWAWIVHGDQPEPNEPMFWGRVDEASTAEKYRELHCTCGAPEEDLRVGVHAGGHDTWTCPQPSAVTLLETPGLTVVNRHRSTKSGEFICMATPDRWVLEPGARYDHRLMQAKNVGAYLAGKYGTEGTDDVAEGYQVQCHWEMIATGWDCDDLAARIGGNSFRYYRLVANGDVREWLWEAAERFWNDYVLPKRMPPVDHKESTTRTLLRMFPEVFEPQRDATDSEVTLMEQCVLAQERMKEAKAQFDRVKNELRAVIAGCEGISRLVTIAEQDPADPSKSREVRKLLRATWAARALPRTVRWEKLARDKGVTPAEINEHTESGGVTRAFSCKYNKAK